MNTKKTNLQIKVLALNIINEHAARCYEHAMNHFSQFIGKDIFKVDGSIKQKFSHETISFEGNLPDGTHYHTHYWYQNRSGYFSINVKTCVNGGSWDVKPSTAFCLYEEINIDLFEVKDGVLCECSRPQRDLSKRYEEAEILRAVEAAKEAAQQYNKVLEGVPYEFRDMFYLKRV